jgi:RNA polymerase primary sigma factor
MANKKGERHPRKLDSDELAMQLLLHHGQREGRLTRGDVLDMVPDAEYDGDRYSSVIDGVRDAGIPVDEVEEERLTNPEGEFPEEVQELEQEAITNRDFQSGILESIEADNIIRLYIQEASQVPLLTAVEEVDLAQKIERCRIAQAELSKGSAGPDRQRELQRDIDDGRAARDRLIRSNVRLVISVARKYAEYGLPLLDLIQEGNIGLMRAVRNFDYHRGFRFSTYATWWIRQAITRALANQGRAVRLPLHVSDAVNRMLREQARLQQKLNRPPTSEELAQVLGVTPGRVLEMMEYIRQPVSLQSPVGEDEEEELGEVISDAATPNPEEAAFDQVMNIEARRRLDVLSPRELQVIQLRYGLSGEPPMTLQEVGEHMGITRERARQLEVQALERLRHPGVQRKRGRPRKATS